MADQRKLTVEENLEQIRLAVLEEIRAYFQGGQPRDQKFVDAHGVFKDVVKYMAVIGAEKNRIIALIDRLPEKMREQLVKKILIDILPKQQAKLIEGS